MGSKEVLQAPRHCGDCEGESGFRFFSLSPRKIAFEWEVTESNALNSNVLSEERKKKKF